MSWLQPQHLFQTRHGKNGHPPHGQYFDSIPCSILAITQALIVAIHQLPAMYLPKVVQLQSLVLQDLSKAPTPTNSGRSHGQMSRSAVSQHSRSVSHQHSHLHSLDELQKGPQVLGVNKLKSVAQSLPELSLHISSPLPSYLIWICPISWLQSV